MTLPGSYGSGNFKLKALHQILALSEQKKFFSGEAHGLL